MTTPPTHLAIDEARIRLRRLRPAEAVRLGELARACARSVGSATEGAEILNEAIARVLEGRRRWPADLPVDVFFAEVMRSIAYELRQRAWREPFLDDQTNPDVAVDPDHRAEVESVTTAVRRSLKDDPPALRLFELELAEMTCPEIQRKLGLDATAYDTLRRRFRRRLLAAFPDGYPL
ncbi:hypothetical protein [Methylobacterium sp. AMS5]|uniref:RNA polymerase sigma factor n=1 Tax=Methylobacterium sp. AMS5 TaxID=925818 RepID=UPI00074F8C79|nr:hypothetical protein [Methylobacterium sp. AMS5]AMB46877.1 hypothetical protein Y590_18220 [Methylobacterium sp. AMS5]